MSLSLTQKLSPDVTVKQRLVIAFANTDEIFAVAMAHFREVTFRYMLGLELLPVLGWTLGTLVGACACDLLPKAVTSALSLALYGMFVAIVMPVAKRSKPVILVACIAAMLSTVIYYVPALKFISKGVSIIVCTIIAAVVGAIVAPRDLETEAKSEQKSEPEA